MASWRNTSATRKPPAHYEVYNDLGGEVVGFFRVLRERPEALIDAIRRTPFARAEIDLACTPAPPRFGEVEPSRRVYVRSWQGRHGLPARGRMGWRFERAATRSRTVVEDGRDVARLWAVADRPGRVQLESDDALRVIARFEGPDTLLCRPALAGLDAREALGRHAYDQELTGDDHRRLAEVLRTVQGMSVISGYACPLYDELYGDWPVVALARRLTVNGKVVGGLERRGATLIGAGDTR